jgi:hypothetical protein
VIHFVVALAAEARPIAQHYGLKARAPRGLFPVFQNEDVLLVITGVGKVASAAATAYLHAIGGEAPNRAWLNVGVAGHGNHCLGTGRLANCITDGATRRSWYPPQVLDLATPSERVITVDKPEAGYAESALYDMEAAGFYPTACACSTAELAQAYKVVSDNRSPESVSAKIVEALVGDRLPEVDAIVARLTAGAESLAAINRPPPELDIYLTKWKFSVSQRHQLKRLLQRWRALTPGDSAWSEEFERMHKSTEVLGAVERKIGRMPIGFGGKGSLEGASKNPDFHSSARRGAFGKHRAARGRHYR